MNRNTIGIPIRDLTIKEINNHIFAHEAVLILLKHRRKELQEILRGATQEKTQKELDDIKDGKFLMVVKNP